LVEFGWPEVLLGTLRMPVTPVDNYTEPQFSRPIGLVPVRDALSRYQHGSVLMVSADDDNVNLVPLREATKEHPEGP
jgi:hypothetical protein